MSAANSAPGWVLVATPELVSVTMIGTLAGSTPANCLTWALTVETIPAIWLG